MTDPLIDYIHRLEAETERLTKRLADLRARLDAAMSSVAASLTPENENVRRGDLLASLADLRQIALSALGNCDTLQASLDAAEQERDLLKAGILAELHGGNSLPDFWTAERQLPYVAKALENARRWHPLETCPRDRDVAFYWRDGNTVVGRFDDWCNDDMPDGWASIPPLPPKE